MLRSKSDPAVPLYKCRAIQGVPPLTGDLSQFDARLDHTDPSPLLDDRQTPVPSGGRAFAVAFAVITALLVGLIVGFAAGFFVAQQTDPISAPRSAAPEVTPMSPAEVSAGAHRVKIELPGFRRWATAVHVESGLRARAGASLETE